MICLTDIEAAGYPVLRPAWLARPAAPPLPEPTLLPRPALAGPPPLPMVVAPPAHRATLAPDGPIWTTVFDPEGNPIETIDPLGVRTTLSRDAPQA